MVRAQRIAAVVAMAGTAVGLAACDATPSVTTSTPVTTAPPTAAPTASTPPPVSATTSSPAPSATIPEGYREALPGPSVRVARVKRAPTIDGDTGDWDGVKTYAVATRVGGQRTVKSVARSTWRLTWDADNLYVLAVVTDPKLTQTHPLRPWAIGTGDSIGIEIGPYTDPLRRDRLNARDTRILIGPSEIGTTLRAVAYADGTDFDTGSTWTTGSADAVRTASGWRVEAAIPWRTLKVDKPGPSTKLSVNLLLADAVSSGSKRGSLGALYSNNPQRIFAGAKARYAWGRLVLTG